MLQALYTFTCRGSVKELSFDGSFQKVKITILRCPNNFDALPDLSNNTPNQQTTNITEISNSIIIIYLSRGYYDDIISKC